MIMRNCIVENTNIRALSVTGKYIFYNCTFNNSVMFTTCTLLNCCFYHCTFKDIIIVDSVLIVNCIGLEDVDFKNNNLDNIKVIRSSLDASVLVEKNKIEGIYIKEELVIMMGEEVVEENNM